MKKITTLCLALAAMLGFVACSDDETGNSYLRENPVQVVKSNLFFNADAQKGGVRFTAPAGTTAYTTEPWATAEVTGDSITVSVTDNASSESRSAVLTIKNGNDSTNLSILQKGGIYQLLGKQYNVVGDEASTLSIPFACEGFHPTIRLKSATDPSAVSDVQFKDNVLSAKIAANNTGKIRQFTFAIDNSGNVDSIMVAQGALKDFLNKRFMFIGYNLMMLTPETTDFTQVILSLEGNLKQDQNGTLYLDFSEDNMRIPLLFDPTTLSFIYRGAQQLGTATNGKETVVRRSAIWDMEHYVTFSTIMQQIEEQHLNGDLTDDEYNDFQQVTFPRVYNAYVSNKLSMQAMMTSTPTAAMGLFVDVPTNLQYIQGVSVLSQLGFPTERFNANLLAFQDFTLKNGKESYRKLVALLYDPRLFMPYEAEGASASAPAMAARLKMQPSYTEFLRMKSLAHHFQNR